MNNLYLSVDDYNSYYRHSGHGIAYASFISSENNEVIEPFEILGLPDMSKVSPLVNIWSSPFSPFGPHVHNTGLMPPGVLHVGSNFVVFERPPSYQNIFYTPHTLDEMSEIEEDGENYSSYVYRVPLPWQVYVAFFDSSYYCSNVYMFFSDLPLTSFDQPVYLPTLPNFFLNGALCRPMFEHIEDVDRYSKDIKGVVESAYDWVWNNGTNNDLTEGFVQLLKVKNNPIVDRLASSNIVISSSHSHALHSSHVKTIFSLWEQLSIDDVLTRNWPLPHFDRYSQEHYSHYVYEGARYTEGQLFTHSSIFDHLPTYLLDYLDVDPDYYEVMIEEEDYSSHEFLQWLINTNKVSVLNLDSSGRSFSILFSYIVKDSMPTFSSSYLKDILSSRQIVLS